MVGLSKPDQRQMVNYKEFSFAAKQLIDELFSTKALQEKAQLLSSGTYKQPDNLDEI